MSLAARWLDPAETEGTIIPFIVLYALHDALVKPMPARLNTPSLHERAMHVPVYELSPMAGIGPRGEQAGVGPIPGFPYSAPYEDVALKKP